MKKTGYLILIFLWGAGFMAALNPPPVHSATKIHYSTLFNPGTVTTVTGVVERVVTVPSGNGRDLCVLAVMRTPQGVVTAVLAPKTYMDTHKLAVTPKEKLTITGSQVTIMGKPHLLVTEVKGDRTMKLREANGRPLWAVGDDWHVR